MRVSRIASIAAVCSLVLAVAACGDDDSGGTTTTDATNTTAMATTTTAMATTTSAAPATTAGGDTTTTAAMGDGVEITISAEDNEAFNTSFLEAPAGVPITLTFENDDTSTGEPHNVRVVTDGEDAFTAIATAPDVQSITFTISTPGEYEYFCDTHPEAMNGTLTITG